MAATDWCQIQSGKRSGCGGSTHWILQNKRLSIVTPLNESSFHPVVRPSVVDVRMQVTCDIHSAHSDVYQSSGRSVCFRLRRIFRW